MCGVAAIEIALSIARQPTLARLAQSANLPAGMTQLLEIAAGEPAALASAQAASGEPEAALRSAASFFIEQVLFAPDVDSYRVLGCTKETSSRCLRRHMVLLMKWMHPDVAANAGDATEIDRSVFATRVTQAWEDLKTDARRTAYDTDTARRRDTRPETTRNGPVKAGRRGPREPTRERGPWQTGSTRARPSHEPGSRQLTVYRIRKESLISRFMAFLWGRL